MSSLPPIRCREIAPSDVEATINLLTEGFSSERTRDHWEHAIEMLSKHPTPPGFPRYGYLLENDEAPVGVVLLIFAALPVEGVSKFRCNVSSWYVQPEFR